MSLMTECLMYENIGGMLVRKQGYLHWSCPLCKKKGQSDSVLDKCPKCKGKQKEPRHE